MKRMAIFLCLFMAMCSPVFAKAFTLYVNSDELIYGVIQRENPDKNPNAVGDKHMHHKAYGLLQIRQPYLDDVNRIAGKAEVRRMWGKDKLTMQDMKEQAKAVWAFHVYLSWYGDVYKKKTGKFPSAYVYARMHNGGPEGWQDKSTVRYGKSVCQWIELYRIFEKCKV